MLTGSIHPNRGLRDEFCEYPGIGDSSYAPLDAPFYMAAGSRKKVKIFADIFANLPSVFYRGKLHA